MILRKVLIIIFIVCLCTASAVGGVIWGAYLQFSQSALSVQNDISKNLMIMKEISTGGSDNVRKELIKETPQLYFIYSAHYTLLHESFVKKIKDTAYYLWITRFVNDNELSQPQKLQSAIESVTGTKAECWPFNKINRVHSSKCKNEK